MQRRHRVSIVIVATLRTPAVRRNVLCVRSVHGAQTQLWITNLVLKAADKTKLAKHSALSVEPERTKTCVVKVNVFYVLRASSSRATTASAVHPVKQVGIPPHMGLLLALFAEKVTLVRV